MKITRKNLRRMEFDELGNGDVFTYEDELFMKMDKENGFNAVSLITYKQYKFVSAEVEVENVELQVFK